MNIKTAFTTESDLDKAVIELSENLRQEGAKLILFFVSPNFDVGGMSAKLSEKLDCPLIAGCTTAGEICEKGFIRNGVAAVSFAGDDFSAAGDIIPNLQNMNAESVRNSLEKCLRSLQTDGNPVDEKECFALTLIDGLSYKEEQFISALALSAPGLKIVGGSASDYRQMDKIRVFLNGRSYANSAVLILFHTSLPFVVFNRHHFIPTETEIIVTAADMSHRIIYEIDGMPALDYYASLLNIPREKITPPMTVEHPFGYAVDDKYYIRSVISFMDNHLGMASAVAEGTVLTLMNPGNMQEDTFKLIEDLRKELKNDIRFILYFNCLGRYEEGESKNINAEVFKAMNICPLAGCNTYGEQYSTLHLNHSLTGIAFGG